MKTWIVLGLAGLISACSTLSGLSPFRINSVDGDKFVVYDPDGNANPKAIQAFADRYCAPVGKSAEFQSTGGPRMECMSNQLRYCLTYICK